MTNQIARMQYGLATYLFVGSVDRAFYIGESLGTEMMAINQVIGSEVSTPFRGMKHSDFSKEAKLEGIDEHLDTKLPATTAMPRPRRSDI